MKKVIFNLLQKIVKTWFSAFQFSRFGMQKFRCILSIVLLLPVTSFASNYAIQVGGTKYFYGTRNSAIFYEASDPSVIKLTPKSVDSNGQWTLEVAGLKQGVSMFYFSYYNSNGVKVNETHTIEVIDINQITIPASLSVKVGEPYKFEPIIQDSRMEKYLLDWESLDKTIADIDDDYKYTYTWPNVIGNLVGYARGGNLTTHKPGDTQIVCTYKNIRAVCELHVEPIYVSEIEFCSDTSSICEFESITLGATVLPDNASDQSLKWKSSNPNVAIVDNKGKVTGLSRGKTLITATANDGSEVSASFILEVVASDDSNEKICHEINLTIDNYVQFSYDVEEGQPYSVNINPHIEDWSVCDVKLDGTDDSANLKGSTYTIEQVTKPANINIAMGYNHNVELIDITTDIDPIITESGIKICKESDQLKISNLEKNSKIKIYTIGGMLIGDFSSNGTECKLILDPGIYLVNVVSESSPKQSFKIKL